jgi:hypothetical protein
MRRNYVHVTLAWRKSYDFYLNFADHLRRVVTLSGSGLSPWALQLEPLAVKRSVAEQTGCHGDMMQGSLAHTVSCQGSRPLRTAQCSPVEVCRERIRRYESAAARRSRGWASKWPTSLTETFYFRGGSTHFLHFRD